MIVRSSVVVLCVIGVAVAVSSVPEGSSWHSQFLSFVDNAIQKTNDLELIDGVTFVKTSEAGPRSVQGDFGMLLLDRLNTFMHTHTLRVDLSNTDSAEESRGKKGGKDKMKKMKSYLIPLILGVKAKMIALAAMAGNLIAFISAKALIVSKIALILGFFLFLKKLVTNPPKDVQHEHIKHKKIVLPQTEEQQMGYWKQEGWEGQRADDLANAQSSYAHELAYGLQRPIR